MISPVPVSSRFIDSLSVKLPFVYEVSILIASANGTNSSNLTFDSATNFLCVKMAGISNKDAVGDIQPNNFTLSMQNTVGGNYFQNLPIPQAIFYPRTGQSWLPEPVVFPATMTMLFQATDLNGNTNNTVTIALIGYKLSRDILINGI